MRHLSEKLDMMRGELGDRSARIMIVGLGSVGNYLLDYLASGGDPGMELRVVGRNGEKLWSDVNIVRVASRIRGQNRCDISVRDQVDLNDIDGVARAIDEYRPDIIVNSSRAYSGLKYGSISWQNIRAYGVWAPLAIKYTKNIMEAYEKVGSDAVVVNTSYSDAVIPWLKGAGAAYPDLGSGNVNHLIPRIKMAVARECHIRDDWNIDVTLAASHFHDVVISKEGHTEGVDMLIDIRYQGERLAVDLDDVFAKCRIPMPVDAKRNQMNASSNFEIIMAILSAVRDGGRHKLHCPGAFGEIGGYPVLVDGSGERMGADICEDYFTLDEMRRKNRESIYLDGVEDVREGVLTYTDELLDKVWRAFGVRLMKRVPFDEIELAADFIIREIIEKNR